MPMSDSSAAPAIQLLVAEIVSNYVKKNQIEPADIPTLIHTVYQSLLAAMRLDGWWPIYGATLAIEANFLVFAVLQFCVLDRSLARIATGEDRHLAQLMIVVPLNAPLARVHPIFEDHGWF